MPLDLFGMDLDVDRDGRIVLFEVQATMIVAPPPGMPEELIAPENGARIVQGFRRPVRRRIAGAGVNGAGVNEAGVNEVGQKGAGIMVALARAAARC